MHDLHILPSKEITMMETSSWYLRRSPWGISSNSWKSIPNKMSKRAVRQHPHGAQLKEAAFFMSNSMQGSHSGSLTVNLVDPITGMGHNLLFPLLDDSTYLNGCPQILSYSQQSWFSVGKMWQFSSSTVREFCAIYHQPGHQMNACPFKSLWYQTNEISRDCIFPHHQLYLSRFFAFILYFFFPLT